MIIGDTLLAIGVVAVLGTVFYALFKMIRYVVKEGE
jgi:hypothetical protein